MTYKNFVFEVTVEVDIEIPADDPYDRTEEQFAKSALYMAPLRDAENLDGWADLTGTAAVIDVDAL